MIEFAIILPVMIILCIGAIDVGITILNKMQIQQAANSAAMAAAQVLPDTAAAEARHRNTPRPTAQRMQRSRRP